MQHRRRILACAQLHFMQAAGVHMLCDCAQLVKTVALRASCICMHAFIEFVLHVLCMHACLGLTSCVHGAAKATLSLIFDRKSKNAQTNQQK